MDEGETSPDPGKPADLPDAVDHLSVEVAKARRVLARTTTAVRRRSYVLGAAVAVAVATAATALVVLVGTVHELGRQQAQLRQQTLASCGEHANQAGWEAFAAGQAAERVRETPGVTPTVPWLIVDLSEQARAAYEQGGCVEHLGPLPTTTPSTPTR